MREPLPALLLVRQGERAALAVLALENGTLTLGRGAVAGMELDDLAISRQHVQVTFAGGRWLVEDLGSRNGTFVDGRELSGPHSATQVHVLRIGSTLFVPMADARAYLGGRVELRGEVVVGPIFRALLEQVERVARSGSMLHLCGESGSGQELVARAFHAYGPAASGPFIAVNCATLAPNLAERVLFGARRGASSGADADAQGLITAADGGTLFLDEVAELELAVQAKLLRVLESHEVLPLGATRGHQVDVRFCSATSRDLQRMAEHGSFREELYFRLARPVLTVPALRERPEEVPALIEAELSRLHPALAVEARFVEECLCRPWPGNVRELCAAVGDAAHAALGDEAPVVSVDHLPLLAGVELSRSSLSLPSMPAVRLGTAAASAAAPGPGREPGHEEVLSMLRSCNGNVSRAARGLGWHRHQLRRWLVREAIDPKTYGDSEG